MSTPLSPTSAPNCDGEMPLRAHVDGQRHADLREHHGGEQLNDDEREKPAVLERRHEAAARAARRSIGVGLGNPAEDNHREGDGGRRVGDEQREVRFRCDQAGDHRCAREPEVDRPIEIAVGARAVRCRDYVSNGGLHRRAEQIAAESEQQRRDRDVIRCACETEL